MSRFVDLRAFARLRLCLTHITLDGAVDIGDLGILASHWQQAGLWVVKGFPPVFVRGNNLANEVDGVDVVQQ